MSCFLVQYDLRKTRDYSSLYEAIKSYTNWAHILGDLGRGNDQIGGRSS